MAGKSNKSKRAIQETRKSKKNAGFSFYSVQEHSHFVDGKGKIVRKEVDIKNGRGMKTVVIRNERGKTRRSALPIGVKEMEKIKNNIFVPGLFKECVQNCR